MSRPQPHYFGAGPALLPTPVLEQASKELLNYNNLGIGVAEMSHRSADAVAIINDAKRKITQLLDVPDTHEVFFAQGGGTGGFDAVCYNMLAAFACKAGVKGKADYFVTGSWSAKAAEEAQRIGANVHIVADSKATDGKYGSIPDQDLWNFSKPEETAYVYYCDNETVHGVEWPTVPEVPNGVELVADMSSNMMSRKIDVSKFGLIFGGAQKNIGIAGVSLYIIKKDLLARTSEDELRRLNIPICPIFLDFPTIVKNNSAYNTISILAVQIVNLYMDYLLAKGTMDAQEAESKSKADEIYKVLDERGYNTLVDPSARSRMNIVFKVDDEADFFEKAEEHKLMGLKGHRSVGGIRVSNYNAVTPESVHWLVKFLKEY